MRKAKPKRSATLKASKVQLRLRPDQKAVLARAAELRRTSLSNFMLEHAYEAAQQVLAEQVDIIMSPAEWDAFRKALDAPRAPSRLSRSSSPNRASSMPLEKLPHDRPVPLEARHDLSLFDCGAPALNNYLKKVRASQPAR